MGSVKQRAGCGQRQCPLRGWSGTSPAQQLPTLALPLARVFLRVFRIVLLEQMSTIPKVGQISLYAVLRGGPGQWGVQGLRANSVNWQSVPAAVPGASPACCPSRTLRLESLSPRTVSPTRPLTRRADREGCDHEQLGEALEGYWRAWRHGPACAGQMQASKLQPHQSGCS